MKFIKPSEISSKIMTLFEESDDYVIVVSPYIKISKWYKLLKKLDSLKNRNIPISFIIRDDKSNQTSFQELNELGLNYTAVTDLHCKLYLNEKYAIVSSMNLLLSSEINSLEIAYSTETEKEYEELIEFCKRYLNVDFNIEKDNPQSELNIGDWRNFALGYFTEQLGSKVRAHEDYGTFIINTGTNNYNCFIWSSGNNNILRVSGILSYKEYSFLNSHQDKYPQVDGIKMEVQRGGNGHYDSIWGSLEIPLKSNDINKVVENENKLVAEKVINFIVVIDDYKLWATKNLR